MAITQRDLDLMAWTLLGEAAGEGNKGMQAVANVIVNRANSGQYPSSISEVVLQPKQFSAWNKGEGGNDPAGRYSKNSEAFQRARAIAEQAVTGQLPDITGGALNYWAPRGMKNGADPYWAKNVPADQRLKIGNHVFLPQRPVPPAPLTAEAPVPATMSRELAYARGLDNPADALAAIQQQIGSANPANQGIASAYTAPTTPQLPMPKPDNWADFYSSVGIGPAKTDTSAFQPGRQNLPPPPPLPDREDPFETIFRQRREAFDLQNVPFASDAALKRLAGDKGQNILDTLAGSDWQMSAAPARPSAAPSPFSGVKYDPVEALATLAMSKPRTTLNDIMGTAPRPPSVIRYPGLAGSNEQPLAERPSSVGPAPARSPLLDWAVGNASAPPISTDVSAFAPRPQALPPVSNMIAPPQTTVPAGTGIGFGMTPAGMLPGVPSAQQANPFVPQTFFSPTPEVPEVNRSGYYQGNPMGNYEVGRGQTLAKIAKQFGTDADTLANINNIPNPNKISSGAKLFVPQLATAPVTAKSGSTATPTGSTVTPAQRNAISSSSGGSSTPVSTYKAPTAAKPATTSQPVGLSNPVVKPAAPKPAASKPAMATTPTGSAITQAQMNAIRGLATGGPVPGYISGGSVTGGTTTYDPIKLQNALQSAAAAKAAASKPSVAPWLVSSPAMAKAAPGAADTVTVLGKAANLTLPGAIADTFMSDKQKADLAQASRVALLKGVSAANGGISSGSRATSPMMDGSPSSSSRGGSSKKSDGSKDNTPTTSTGGIDGVIGTYKPPTQAQIDALYAPYFRAAQFPPAGYVPGVSGEFNYFPTTVGTPGVPMPPPTTPTPTTPPTVTPASSWFTNYMNAKTRAEREAAKKAVANGGKTFYSLFDTYRDSLGRKVQPTLDSWLSWYNSQKFATGGEVSEPRLVLGKGGPTADKVPARIDGVQEARLSNGEFVMTAAAVRGLGNGDYKRGAEALMRLNDQFAPRRDKGTLKVEKVR